MITVPSGGSAPLAEAGPFKLTASCASNALTVTASTTEPNSIAPRQPDIGGFGSQAQFGPGQDKAVLAASGGAPLGAFAADFALAAPSGFQMIGHLWGTQGFLGLDPTTCAFGGLV